MPDLYETIGVNREASQRDIKKAYREKALRLHPDHGGDEKEFKSLALAYRILSDEEKRKRYDNGENPDSLGSPTNEKQQAVSILCNIYLGVIEQYGVDLEHSDLRQLVLEKIEGGQGQIRSSKVALEAKIERYQCALKRMRVKTGMNYLSGACESQIANFKNSILVLDGQMKIGDLARQMLEDYEYDFEELEEEKETPNPQADLFRIANAWGIR